MLSRRQEAILKLLKAARTPVSGGKLADRLGVSRPTIVQDLALLRAAGHRIFATPRGYTLSSPETPRGYQKVVAVQHAPHQTEDELTSLVDLGVRVRDVVVEHPLYGELRGLLLIESREDVREFLERLATSGAGLLSATTGGIHLHTLEAPRPELLERAVAQLRERGYLLEGRDPSGEAGGGNERATVDRQEGTGG